MTIEKVGPEIISGTDALRRLVNMLGIALESSKITIAARSAGWEWIGYYIDENRDIWVGVRYDSPQTVFASIERPVLDAQKFAQLGGQWKDGYPRFQVDLTSDALQFFKKDAEGQLDFLKGAVQQICENARLSVLSTTSA